MNVRPASLNPDTCLDLVRMAGLELERSPGRRPRVVDVRTGQSFGVLDADVAAAMAIGFANLRSAR